MGWKSRVGCASLQCKLLAIEFEIFLRQFSSFQTIRKKPFQTCNCCFYEASCSWDSHIEESEEHFENLVQWQSVQRGNFIQLNKLTMMISRWKKFYLWKMESSWIESKKKLSMDWKKWNWRSSELFWIWNGFDFQRYFE